MKSILIVDDNEVCRLAIKEILQKEGYQTFEAINGQEAMLSIQANNSDLVLLDVAMPVMDGLTCVRELRNRPELAKLPIIMLTGVSEREILREAPQLGTGSFLSKSVLSAEMLLSRVRSLIGDP